MKKNSTKKALLMSVLSLLLCISMLIGTTYAWFTDTVTSASNIIKAGTLDVELYWADGDEDPAAATYADASTGAIFNYELWEPGFTQARHLKIANVGSLALKYQLRILANGVVSKLADVIDVYYYDTATKLTRDNYATAGVKLGTLSEVINNFGEKVYGTLLAGKSKTVTLALHMQESAGNEYQNLSIGTDFSVQLLATQYTYEEDSFDNLYDENADFAAQEIPSAMVSELSDLTITAQKWIGETPYELTLNAGYKFEPTETYEQAQQSKYAHSHADFYVYADRDIPAGSVKLAGWYNEWCQLIDGNWITLDVTEDVPANTGVRLVEALADVSYEEICKYGNDGKGFQCGIVAVDPIAVAGTTVTVELRLYDVKDPSETANNTWNEEVGPDAYTTVGKFTYTFPAAKVEGQAALEAALAKGTSAFELAAGTYQIPASAKGKTLTISGSEDVVIEHVNMGEDGMNYNLEGSTVTFNGVTIKTASGTYRGFARSTAIEYNNCNFVGTYTLGAGAHTFNDCHFNLKNNYVWTWGGTNVVFDGCTFEDENGMAKAILVHNTVATEVTVKDCDFIATTGAKTWDGIDVAAVSIDPNGAHTAKVTFEGTNDVDTAFAAKWQIKYAEDTALVTVIE